MSQLMNDLADQLKARATEVQDYIKTTSVERSDLMARVEDHTRSIEHAREDLARIEKAITVLVGEQVIGFDNDMVAVVESRGMIDTRAMNAVAAPRGYRP